MGNNRSLIKRQALSRQLLLCSATQVARQMLSLVDCSETGEAHHSRCELRHRASTSRQSCERPYFRGAAILRWRDPLCCGHESVCGIGTYVHIRGRERPAGGGSSGMDANRQRGISSPRGTGPRAATDESGPVPCDPRWRQAPAFCLSAVSGAEIEICRSKLDAPVSNSLVRDDNTSLRKQGFDIAEAECESMVGPDSMADIFRRESKTLM
jgi:hypothetical protein